MNIRHEIIITYTSLLGFTALAKSRGIDLTKEIEPQLENAGMTLTDWDKLTGQLITLLEQESEVIAELRDLLLILPLVRKKPDRSPILQSVQQSGGLVQLPVVAENNRLLSDNGNFALSWLSIGREVEKFEDITQIHQQYPSFADIPNWPEYKKQIIANLKR